MTTNFELVKEFMTAMDQEVHSTPVQPEPQTVRLRMLVILEEVAELMAEMIAPNKKSSGVMVNKATIIQDLFGVIKENILHMDDDYFYVDHEKFAKEAADLHYVTYGTEAAFGINADAAMAEVHRSNMSKLDDDGKPIKNEHGKVLKGPNYKPADMAGVLKNQEVVCGWG